MKRFLALVLLMLFSTDVGAQYRSGRGYIGGITPETVQIENPSDTFPVSGGSESVQIKIQSQQADNHGIVVQGSSTVSEPRISLIRSRGSVASPSIVSLNDPLGIITFYGYAATSYEPAVILQSLVDATPGINDMPGRLEILTTPDGSTTPTLSLTVADAAGVVLILEGSIQLDEQATADSSVTGYGQLWVKNTSPAELWFTDDIGGDEQLSGAGSALSGSGVVNTIPMWVGATTLGDSIITYASGNVSIGTNALFNSEFNIYRESISGGNPDLEIHAKDLAGGPSIFGNAGIILKVEDEGANTIAWLLNNNGELGTFTIESVGIGSVIRIDKDSNTLALIINQNLVGINAGANSADFQVQGDTNDNLIFTDATTDQLGLGTGTLTNTFLTIDGATSLKEQSAADTFTAAYGQLWIKDTDPNEFWWTDDTDVNHQIAGGVQSITTLTTSGDVGLGGAIATSSLVNIEGTVALAERPAASAFTVGYGQLWVRDDSPAVLVFTDDAGSDFLVGGGGSGGTVTGTGVTNAFTKWSGVSTIDDAIMNEVSNEIGVNTTTPDSLFDVRDSSGGIVSLTTSEVAVVDGTVLGQLNFVAPEETSGGDGLFVAASIWGESEAAFSAADNSASLVFATGESEVAVEKMRLTAEGVLGIGIDPPTNANAGDAVLEGGAIILKERVTPTADTGYAKVYSKTDNELYFQDGAGSETQISNTVVSAHSDTTATGTELETLTDGSDSSALHVHTIVSLDTTATGAELTTLTDSSETTLHSHAGGGAHTIASHSDTSGTGAELDTLTDGSDSSVLHVHTVVSLDTTGTGAQLTELTNSSETTLHSHAGGGGGIGGSGTVGTIPIFVTDTTTIGDSNITVISGNVTITKADTNIFTVEDSSANGTVQTRLKNDVQTYAWQLFSNDQLFLSDITGGTFPMKVIPGAPTSSLVFAVAELIVNSDGTDIDFRVESDISTHGLFLRASDGSVGINNSTPTAQFHVVNTIGSKNTALFERNITPATAPVVRILQDAGIVGDVPLELQQDTTTGGFINFVGSDRGGVPTSTVNSVASIRVEINGTVYVIALHADQ